MRSPMLQREGPVPMAQAEKAAVVSALMLMITSGLCSGAAPAPQCTVASAATPSGDAGSASAFVLSFEIQLGSPVLPDFG